MFFQVESLTDCIYRISMPYVCCYLIVGQQKAILLDTGWGYGDLKQVVESITNLPITVVLSHGHADHSGGSVQFDEVYLNKKDLALAINRSQISTRRRIMLSVVPNDFKENIDNWQPPKTNGYLPLTSDMTFDLGGLTLLPFDLPGHTAGHMVFIIPEERIAIFGDTISHPTLMYLPESSKIKSHYEAMLVFSKYSHLYDRALVNHETYELDKIVLDNNIQLARKILDGTDEKISTPKHNKNLSGNADVYYASKKKQPWLPSEPSEIGNIYYTEDKLK